MARILSIREKELTAGMLSVRGVEGMRQVWRDGKVYTGFTHRPRPKSGLVFICSDIKGRFETADGRCVVAGQGDVVYIPRGTLYTVSFTGGKPDSLLDSYTLHFHLFDETGEEILLSDTPTVLVSDPARRLTKGVEAVLRAVNGMELASNAFQVGLRFLTLLEALIDLSGEEEGDLYPIRAGVEALLSEWDRNEKMSRYAELCGICESYFYLLFKKWAGVSPVEYRNRRRLQNSGVLLLNTELSVGEVAAAVGFDDPFYFSRAFRRAFGLSPQQYRKQGGGSSAT